MSTTDIRIDSVDVWQALTGLPWWRRRWVWRVIVRRGIEGVTVHTGRCWTRYGSAAALRRTVDHLRRGDGA